jgi:hypothetical protein
VTTGSNSTFEGRRAVRYIGQYKPTRPYALNNGYLIVPAESAMIPYVSGSQAQMNISYFVAAYDLSDSALKTSYREWLAFDAFVLHDHCPIYYFDKHTVGEIERVPVGVPKSTPDPGYKQIDYENIAQVMLMAEAEPNKSELPRASYSELFVTYRGLHLDLKDMIEWSVSFSSPSSSRVNAFFNLNYWQLFHATILLERLIGLPPNCPQSFGTCPVCSFSPQPHYAMPRRKWTREVLEKRISDDAIVEEYDSVIDTGIRLRNKMAHTPLFDRSTYPELSPGERLTYEVERVLDEYEHDAHALLSLLISLRTIARYLLLDKVFGTRYFARLRPLYVASVGGN